ncbi:MAG: amidohydrolase [Proteobacteria bacterium]|nr:amidohydrolase [Pseudomonadota bacterium]MBU4295388.1 amidohydrolase [Pseudomonadota bacterium]MCG2748906.1 amidohydrolase [Desulfobulbaceae bacterium]
MKNSLTPDSQLISWMTDIRRSIHQYPELALQEYRTAEYVSGKLEELSISYKKRVASTGIVAFIGEKKSGAKSVALRADMDALPITEKTGLPFSSKNAGIMHACGHDGHMAMLLGAAALLKNQPQLPGQIVLLFQPAEEDEGGAEKMIAAGALEGVDAIFGGHIERHYGVGEISVQPGIICAFTDEFQIIIRGPGGHAAKPHESVDCIVAASFLVASLQTLVSRETNPVFPAVITIGKINGGTATNVIADQVVLEGTIRTTHAEAREKIFESLRRMVLAVQDLYKTETELTLTAGYPPVINDTLITEVAREAAWQTVGEHGVKNQPYPSLGGEDFSFYLKRVPGCFVRFGARRDDLPHANAHSPIFDFDERVLPIGAEYLARCALLFLQQSMQI